MNRSVGPLAWVIVAAAVIMAGVLVYWQVSSPDPNKRPTGPRAPGTRAPDGMGEVSENLKEGKEAPEISGVDMDGKEIKLSDYKGKVVLLDFWGFW